MRKSKTMFVCALICSVGISAAVGPFCSSVCRGDINGDHRVNIIDAQQLVAQMLTGAIPAAEADVNRDGQVDVRDLQFVLARMDAQTSSEDPVPSEKKSPRAILVSTERFWVRAYTSAIDIVRVDSDEKRVFHHFSDAPFITLSPHTERYLYTLTANAPPFLA